MKKTNSIVIFLIMLCSSAIMFATTSRDSLQFVGNMHWSGNWNTEKQYNYHEECEVPVVVYQGAVYVAVNHPTKGVNPTKDSKAWFPWPGGGGGGIDTQCRAQLADAKGTDNYNDPVAITLKDTKEQLSKKADSDNVITAVTVEGEHPIKGILDLKAGNTNIEITEDGQSIKFSPKGQAGGVTSLFGMTGDIGLKSSDGSVTYTKDGTDIDTKAKGGTGGVSSWLGMTGDIEVVSSDGTITFTKDGQKVDIKSVGGGDGVVSINGLKGVVVMDSPKKSITFNNNGQTIEMESKGGGGEVNDSDVKNTVDGLSDCATVKDVNQKMYMRIFAPAPDGLLTKYIHNDTKLLGDTLKEGLNALCTEDIINESKVEPKKGTLTKALNTLNDK